MPDRPIIFSATAVRAILAGWKSQHRLPIGDLPTPPSMDIRPGNVARHERPYLDAYCGERITAENPRGMSTDWCWWTRDDRCGACFKVGFAPGGRLWVRESCRAEELSRPQRSRPATRRERQALGRTTMIECDMLDGADGVRYLADDEWIKIENSATASDAWSNLFHYRGRGVDRCGHSVPAAHMPRWASRLTLFVTDVRVQRLHDISEEDGEAEGAVCTTCANVVVPAEGFPSYRSGFGILWESLHGAGAWAATPWVAAITFTVHRANIDALPVAAPEMMASDV